MVMRRHKPDPLIEAKAEMRILLARVPKGADASHPRMIEVLEAWREVPYELKPFYLAAAHVGGANGHWVTGDPAEVLRILREWAR